MIATVSGQSYKHGVYSTVQDVPAIVVNDNPAWRGGMVVGAGIDMVAGWRGPDMRMFDNLIGFMVSYGKLAPPVSVATITDDTNGFTELDGVWDIETVEISGRTYAVAGSFADDGVQLIDLSNPTVPVPVAAITDGIGGFDKLNGVVGIEIVKLDGRTYVAVASVLDDSVQIMEIVNNGDPIPVAAITDGIDGFEMLDGARDIAIANIEGRTYAIVVSSLDDGVQIIDITDPQAPAPVAAITDGIDGFEMLDGARDIAIANIEGRTYAIVVSSLDDGVQIIDITDPADPAPIAGITDGIRGFTELGGAVDVEIIQMTGRTYALVTGYHDDSVQIIDITDPQAPAPVAAITDGIDGFDKLNGAVDVEIIQMTGRTYALVTGYHDDSVQIIDITDPQAPAPVAAITDGIDGFEMLDGARDIAIANIEGRTYAIVASTIDDGVQVIDFNPTDSYTSLPSTVSQGGFYTNLDAIITVIDYQRSEYGHNSLIQITTQITNQEDLVLRGPNHQNNYKDGEILIFLGGTMPPPSKGTEYRNSFGYGDKSAQWLRGNGANVSTQDCTSEGYWTNIQPTETGVEKLCFWVPQDFTPDGLFVATYDVLSGQITDSLTDVVIRAQIIPFVINSAYCSDHPDICNVSGLQTIDSDTYTEPHPPYVHYVSPVQ